MKNIKKILSMVLVLAMVVAMTACSGSGGDSEGGDGGDGYRVAFIARASADTFAAWLTREMQSEAEKYDDITLEYFSGEGDNNQVNSLLEDCVTKQYDLVIVQVNDNAASAPYVKQVVDAGIPVITTNPAVHQGDLDGTDDDSLPAGPGTVDAAPVAQAQPSAEAAVEEIPENANVVVLMGPSNNFHSDGRRDGWEQYFFAERPDVTILYEDYANWNSDEALALMETWVQGGTHIDAIISMNDNMAAGAIRLLQ